MNKNKLTPKEPPKRRHRPVRMSSDEIKEALPDWKTTGASLAQARFAACYITNGFNATQAYIDSVCHNATKSTASQKGSAWLRDVKVQACIQQYTTSWLAECRAKLEGELIRTYMAQAFYDPKKFFNPDGSLAFDNWDILPEDLRRCVESIETKFYGKDADASVTVIKMADRNKAMQALAQYISLMQGQNATLNLNVSPDTDVLLRSIFSKAKPVTGIKPKDPREV